MSTEVANEIYTKLVHWVAGTAPDDWRRVTVNMEMAIDGQEVANSWIMNCFVGEDGVELDDYPASALEKIEMLDLFEELNELSAKDGDRWTVCDLAVMSDGKYTVDYKYTPPPRLNGDIFAGAK